MENGKMLWWQTGIIYQVYPRSFQDSNGDGIGDLRGVVHRLGYLQWLGVTAIWLSPVYPSPMADFGYDVSDYTDIDPLFGSLDDLDELLREAHSRNIRIILDLVPNHTSDRHPWFLESRSSRSSAKRDWYIWKDAQADGSPPNNWLSVFGGPAWEWDETTGQYYYHAFLKEQPDLNWRNPEVQQAMFDVMRFWLDRGVDGFRVDVTWHLIKDDLLRDNPVNPDYQQHMATYEQLLPVYSTDHPEVHDIVRKMRDVLDAYHERVMISEIYLPIDRLVAYYGQQNDGAHLPFNFLLLAVPWDSLKVAAAIDQYEATIPKDGWPNWVLGNHDQPRLPSRIGSEQARVAAILLLTLRGTPTIYYGEELGMTDVPIPPEEVQDPQGLNMPDKNLSRDPARTPMQWDDSPNAGFSTGKPWLRVSRSYKRVNVKMQRNDPSSYLTLYRRLIHLRQSEPSLMYGAYRPVYADHQALAYIRHHAGARAFLVVLNFSHRPCYVRLDKPLEGTVVLAVSPEMEGMSVSGVIYLAGDEGLVAELTPESLEQWKA